METPIRHFRLVDFDYEYMRKVAKRQGIATVDVLRQWINYHRDLEKSQKEAK